MLRAGVLLLVAVGLAGCAPASPRQPVAAPATVPQRIVSMNPCIDAVLMDVADPAQIAAISAYSHDPRATSIPIEQARRFAAVAPEADQVLAASPDLVLAGPHVSIQTIAALKRLGIPLIQFPVAESVEQSKAQIAAISARIGHTERGAALNRRIDAALAAARWPGAPLPALIWQGSGLVPGKGTLADELLSRTGFANLSGDLGLKQWDLLPLEGLLSHPPAVLLAGQANMGAGDADANRMLSHPALQKAGTSIRVVDYPSGLLHCGGPVIVRSVERLAQVRREVAANGQEKGS